MVTTTPETDVLDAAGVTCPAQTLVVHPMQAEDGPWVAGLHVSDLAHGLFPLLGVRFVARWHAAHLASPYAVGLVALRNGVPVGFALGSVDRPAHLSWLLDNRRGDLACAGLRALATRPRVAATFVRTRAGRYAQRLLRRPMPTRAPAPTLDTAGVVSRPSGPAVLDAIVVAPLARRSGVGSALLDAFVKRVEQCGRTQVELVTKAGADGAAGFYDRRGWERVGHHRDRDGDGVLTYRRTSQGPT